MPYIPKEEREIFNQELKSISSKITSAGQLNYCITVLLHYHIKKNGKSYTNLNECIGVLEAAKLEFYREVVAPYEGHKCLTNSNIGILD